MLLTGFLIGLAAYALFALPRFFHRVDEGHVAALTTFGAAERDPKGGVVTRGPGLHFKLPWQRALVIAMKEQALELSGESGGRSALAADGTPLRLDSTMRFIPVAGQLEQYLFGLARPREHITGLFTSLVRNEIANFHVERDLDNRADLAKLDFARDAGSYALLRRELPELNRRIERFCEDTISSRYGVRFTGVDLIDLLPPEELSGALDAVMNASAEADVRYYRAEGVCHQRAVAAERSVAIAKNRADAVASEIVTIAESLASLDDRGVLDAYVQRRRDEVAAESRALFINEGSP